MASRYMIPTWEVVSGEVDGSVNQARAIPDTLEKLLINAEDIPSVSKTPLRQYYEVADGATGNVDTWTAPFACKIVAAGGNKGAVDGGASCKIELLNATPAAILDYDLNTTAGLAVSAAFDYSLNSIAAGAVLTIKRTKSADDNGALVWFDIVPQ